MSATGTTGYIHGNFEDGGGMGGTPRDCGGGIRERTSTTEILLPDVPAAYTSRAQYSTAGFPYL